MVIRRLILCGPYTPEEAAAATLMAEKMVGPAIAYRASPVERRILMFQSNGITFFESGRRRQHARILDDPAAQSLAVINAAVVKGEPIINVFTGLERDGKIFAYSGTDAVLTFGLPDGTGVAYFARVAGGVAPDIARQCLRVAHRASTSPWHVPHDGWMVLCDGVRFSFLKRKPTGWQSGRELAIDHARRLLAKESETYGL
jgi:hypothetical protein